MTYGYHLVLVQGLSLYTCVKLLGVIQFLYLLAMARNQHGRHRRLMKKPQKGFMPQYCCVHNITVENGYIRTDCCFYVRFVKHNLQDGWSALIYYLLKSKMLMILSTNTSCSKRARSGSIFPSRTCYWDTRMLLNSTMFMQLSRR